jgi:hypothetical protein
MAYPKGKSAIGIAAYGGKQRKFLGQHFPARGYWLSMVGHTRLLYVVFRNKRRQIKASTIGSVRRRRPL